MTNADTSFYWGNYIKVLPGQRERGEKTQKHLHQYLNDPFDSITHEVRGIESPLNTKSKEKPQHRFKNQLIKINPAIVATDDIIVSAGCMPPHPATKSTVVTAVVPRAAC